MNQQKLLLIEDDITLGDLLVEVLTGRGYTVDWYVRARLDDRGKLIFMTDRGREHDFDSAQPDFDCALVDSRLKSSVMQGVDVTKALVARGVKVIATSGLSSLNKEMLKVGASAAMEKHEIFSRKFGRELLQDLLARPDK